MTEEILTPILGLSMTAAGLLLLIAARVGPNPVIGFRIGYTMVSRRVWRRVNEVAAVVTAATGLASVPLGLYFGIKAQILFLVALSIVEVIVLTEYARRLAEKSLISEPPVGEEALIAIRPARLAMLCAAWALAGVPLSVAAAVEAWRLGLPVLSVLLLGFQMQAIYLTYLAVKRPEALILPTLKRLAEPVSEFLACLSPSVSMFLSLMVLSASLWLAALAWIPAIIAFSRLLYMYIRGGD